MRVVFTEEASADLFESAAYYESREAGLGMRFRGEVATVLQSASASPQLLRERPEGFRRVDCVNSNTNRHGCILPRGWPVQCFQGCKMVENAIFWTIRKTFALD